MASSTRPAATRTQSTPRVRAKKSAFEDTIDLLDSTSGLSASLRCSSDAEHAEFHHAGPFDAASSQRNHGNAAAPPPIAAFDPAALSPASIPAGPLARPPRQQSRGAGRISPRAQATLAAMDDSDAAFLSRATGRDSAYAALPSVSPETSTTELLVPRPRRNSEASIGSTAPSVTLGFPAQRVPDKAKGLAEMYGMVDTEAYQDFGKASKARPGPGLRGGDAASRSLRDQRAASVWDMEATLREGKPIGAVPPLPPMPPMPGRDDIALAVPGGDGPKRSKSLMQRIKKARKDPNAPFNDTADDAPAVPSPASSPNGGPRLRSGTIRRGDISAPTPIASANERALLAESAPATQAMPRSESTGHRASVTADMLASLAFDDDGAADDVDDKSGLTSEPTTPRKTRGQMPPPAPIDLPSASDVDELMGGGGGLGRKPSLVQRIKGRSAAR